MTRLEFMDAMLFVSNAIGKDLEKARMDAFWEMLKDLDYAVFRAGCQRVILEHPWPSFPSIAELRQAAADVARGQTTELSPGEAWSIAWSAAGRIDLEVDGCLQRETEGIPKIVLEAMQAFGIPALCYGKEPVTIVRAQFIKIFEGLQARDRRSALLPAALVEKIEGKRPAAVAAVVGRIGVER